MEDDVGFLYKTMLERDPGKRRVKPVQHHLLQLDFGGLEDSSDDSDYQVKHKHDSSDGSGEAESDDEDSSPGSDDSGGDESGGSEVEGGAEGVVEEGVDLDMISLADSNSLMAGDNTQTSKPNSVVGFSENEASSLSSSHNVPKIRVCCVCLGDHGDEDNEVVECDGCGVAVHEGCYGIGDSQSAASTVSSASTEPWFCEACKAGVKPHCELCPNTGGIFKETDNYRWVHIVCALYIPGVAFGDVDKLSPVTLFEMPYTKWGAKECSLCEDENYSCTGVCISCDAGLCRNYFHVTCAQKEGLLSEAGPDEEIADPFYAYCKQHVEKGAARAKRRNHLAIQSSMRRDRDWSGLEDKEKARVQRKLHRHRQKYQLAIVKRPPCWQPTEKMARMLFSSPSATKRLMKKAELLGISTQAQLTSHKDIRKKWHVPAAFSTEYVSYYMDRNERITTMRTHSRELQAQKHSLRHQDNLLRTKYDKYMDECERVKEAASLTLHQVEALYSQLSDLGDKPVKMPHTLRPKKCVRPVTKKEVVKSTGNLPTVIHQCALCSKTSDQHLLAKCDKCRLFYHLGCLNPPLTRMPKKTKLMGWQCSECASSSSDDSGDPEVNPDAPRRLRDKIKEPRKFEPSLIHQKERRRSEATRGLPKRGRAKKKLSLPAKLESQDAKVPLSTPLKKSSPEKAGTDKQPKAGSETQPKAGSETQPKPMPLKVKDTDPPAKNIIKSPKISSQAGAAGKKATRNIKEAQKLVDCCVCLQQGDITSTVKCDNCTLYYHLQCLDPPQTKSPRYIGYAWFCSACQEDEESDEEEDDASIGVITVRPSPLRFNKSTAAKTGEVVITQSDNSVIKTSLKPCPPVATSMVTPGSPSDDIVHEIISSDQSEGESEPGDTSSGDGETDESDDKEVIVLDEEEDEEDEEEEINIIDDPEDIGQIRGVTGVDTEVKGRAKVKAVKQDLIITSSNVRIIGPDKVVEGSKAKVVGQEKVLTQQSKVKIIGRATKQMSDAKTFQPLAGHTAGEGSYTGQSSSGVQSSSLMNVSPRSGLPSRVKRPMILSRSPVKSNQSENQETFDTKRQRLDL